MQAKRHAFQELQLLCKLLLLLQQAFTRILEGTCGLCFLLQLLYMLLQLLYSDSCLQSRLSGELYTCTVSGKPTTTAYGTSGDISSLDCMRRR